MRIREGRKPKKTILFAVGIFVLAIAVFAIYKFKDPATTCSRCNEKISAKSAYAENNGTETKNFLCYDCAHEPIEYEVKHRCKKCKILLPKLTEKIKTTRMNFKVSEDKYDVYCSDACEFREITITKKCIRCQNEYSRSPLKVKEDSADQSRESIEGYCPGWCTFAFEFERFITLITDSWSKIAEKITPCFIETLYF